MPAHLRRLTDSSYLAAGAGLFILGAAVQLGLYWRLLRTQLRAADLEVLKPAIRRWIVAAVVWQGLVVVGAGLYVILLTRQHPAGVSWILPPLGVLLGTGLPLQLVASSALRAGFRGPR